MTRNRITLATAVALSMSLAGCTPARFDPNAPANNPAAANPSTTTPGISTPGGTPPPGGTTTPVATNKSTVLKGLVSLSTGPLASARIEVVDAYTNAPLTITGSNIVAAGAGNIVAAGAGNYRHVNQAAGSAVQTDGSGQFALEVKGLGSDQLARIIATTADGKTLTTLVAGNGDSLDGNANTANLNATTTLVDLGARPSLELASHIAPSGYQILANTGSANLDLLQNFSKVAKRLPFLTGTLEARVVDVDLTGAKGKHTATLQILKDTGTLDDFQSYFTTVAAQYVAAEKAGKVLSTVDTTNPVFKSIAVDFTAKGEFVVDGKVVAGADVTPPDSTKPDNSGNDGAVDGKTLNNPSVNKAIYTSGSFQPKAKIYQQNGTPDTTTIDVEQSQGQEDIRRIVARFTGGVTFTPAATLGTGTTSDPKSNAPGTSNLTVNQDGAAIPTGNLPALMGGTALASLTNKWAGHLKNNGNDVATFHVLADADYIYVVTVYAMSDSFALTTAGHNTELITHSLALTASNGNAEVYMESRQGQTALMLNAVATGPSQGFPIP